jgi:hypothetical protein
MYRHVEDLGSLDTDDYYSILCTNCFWSWYWKNHQQYGYEDAIYEFDYETNTYVRPLQKDQSLNAELPGHQAAKPFGKTGHFVMKISHFFAKFCKETL